MARSFSGRTFVLRIDRSPIDERTTLAGDLAFLMQRNVRPIVVAPTADAARSYVRSLNRQTNIAVGLCGADAALLPAGPSAALGRVQVGILATLTEAGYIPVIEPTALALRGDDVELSADDVASAIAAATDAARAIFFHESGGVIDPTSNRPVAADETLDPDLRAAVRAAAHGVRAGVGAAQIVDGRIAHAAIVEFLTDIHLGTQVAGTVYIGAA
jgi:acetylglutamate kinase